MESAPFSALHFDGSGGGRPFRMTIARLDPKSRLFRISITTVRTAENDVPSYTSASTVNLTDELDTSLPRIVERILQLVSGALDTGQAVAIEQALRDWLSVIF